MYRLKIPLLKLHNIFGHEYEDEADYPSIYELFIKSKVLPSHIEYSRLT